MNYRLEPAQNYRLNNPPIVENQEGGLNISEFKNIVLRKWPLILGCTIGITSIAFLKILFAPPIYTAQFELLSEPVNIETQVTSSNEDSRKTREEITEVDLDEVQLKILKSPRLISRVVTTLEDEYPDLSYGELISDLNIDIVSGSQEDQNILVVVYQNPDKQKVDNVIKALTKIYQDYSVEKRQSGVRRGIAFLDRQIPQISAQTKKIENQITQLRTQYNFNNPDTSLNDITARMSQLDQKTGENRRKLQELKRTLNILDQELVTQPANLTLATSFATPRYLALLNRLQQLDVNISQKSTIFSDQSEVLQALKQEKQQLILLITEAGADTRRKLAEQIAVLENRQQSIASEKENLKIQLRQWSEISGEYKSLQHQLNKANSKLNAFISQKDLLQIDEAQQESPWQLLTPAGEPVTNKINTINYLLLSSTLGLLFGTGLAFVADKQENIIYNSAKIEGITSLPIVAAIPYSPKPKQLPFLKPINFKKEVQESSIQKSSIQVASFFQKQKIASLDCCTPSIEAFRSFAVNIGLLDFNNNSENLNFDTNIKSIAITSAIPREGKSTIALNLARATASMGKKVLIVDTDLRSNKHLTRSLGFESEIGLRNMLEHNVSYSKLDYYIQPLPLEENLYILGSGINNLSEKNNGKDPSRLLASEKMHHLMDEFKKQFDLVIYDLCSIVGFADVNLLATKTDGIVLVTGLGRIHSEAFAEALYQLKLCNAPIIGVALNKLVN